MKKTTYGDVVKILVTGAGGYIGNVLTEMLMERGHDVVALDRFLFGKDLLPPDLEDNSIVEGDIRTVGKSVFEDVDGIVDLAALSNAAVAKLYPESTFAVNHLGRTRIAAISKAVGVRKYILPSSCEVYGFNEDWADETSQISPFTVYSKANLLAEQDILSLSDRNFSATVIRQATVYGKSRRMRLDLVVNDLVSEFFSNKKILLTPEGKQRRPFVHIRDTSSAMIKILESEDEKVNGQIYNVGSNEQNYRIFDLATKIAQSLELDMIYEWRGTPDSRSYMVRFDKIKRDLGFEPKYDIGKGSLEVWKGIEDGEIDIHDPRTITANWYQNLAKNGTVI